MSDQPRLMAIINPISGTASKQDADRTIKRMGERYGYEVDIRFTTGPNDATRLAREAIELGYYGVIACGGDGTVNETASALCGSSVVLGIVPMGSGNGLARHLNVPINLRGAMRVIGENRVRNCDYATANDRPFFCTFGVGFDADVTEKFSHKPKRGLTRYLQATLDELIKYHSEDYVIMTDNQVLSEKAMLVACCNASQYGNNAYIAPRASIKDGLLDITVVHKGSPLKLAMAGFDILTGLVGKTTNATTFRAKEVTIVRRVAGPVHLDGEPAQMGERITVKCHHGKLLIFTTARKSKYRRWLSPHIPFLSPMVLAIQDLGYKILGLFRY